MSARWGFGLAGVLSLVGLMFAPAAPAATEVGSNCVADQTQFNSTLVQLYNRPGAELPIAAPADGVLTQWKVNLGSVGSLPLQLKVLEPGGYPNDFHVVAQSPVVTGSPGQNVIDSRLPVKAGYRFGLYSQDGQTPYCHTAFAQDTLGYALGDAKVTSTYTFSMETQAQVPVAAKIEPDVDGDGYGDETQDGCPQNAAAHVQCPSVVPVAVPPPAPLKIEALPQARERSVNLLVTASVKSLVVASGTVKLGKEEALVRTAPKIVDPGRIIPFTLKFRPRVRKRLEELSPAQSLKLKILVKARDSLGRPAQIRATVPLPGQG